MRNFKSFLAEGSIESGDWMCKTKESFIEHATNRMGYSDVELFKYANFNEAGPWTELTFLETLYFSHSLKDVGDAARLPFKIRTCETLEILSDKLDTLFGSPETVEKCVNISSC
ncbi:MAG: hypothetical protein QXN55_00440 [Candidatus Nitrosotenuis sp.]